MTHTRRTFIKQLSIVGAVAALPMAAWADSDGGGGGFEAAGSVSDFAEGTFKRVTLPSGSTIYVAKDGNSPAGFLALSSRCTHRNGEVLWLPGRKVFRCPLHGGEFDATGKNIAGPPPSPLQTLQVKVDQNQVLVQV